MYGIIYSVTFSFLCSMSRLAVMHSLGSKHLVKGGLRAGGSYMVRCRRASWPVQFSQFYQGTSLLDAMSRHLLRKLLNLSKVIYTEALCTWSFIQYLHTYLNT
jgi:hypothetical protein